MRSTLLVLLAACHGSPAPSPPADVLEVDARSKAPAVVPASATHDAGHPLESDDPAALRGRGDDEGRAPTRWIVLDTDAHELRVMGGKRTLKAYAVGIGRGGVGKEQEGDGKTPRGEYRLFPGRPSTRFGRFLPVGYPNAEDADRGLARGLITEAQHRSIVAATKAGRLPPQTTPLGGHIGVHGYLLRRGIPPGLQVFHRIIDATEGCILMRDADAADLEERYEGWVTLSIR